MINNEWEHIFNEDKKNHSCDAMNIEFLNSIEDDIEPEHVSERMVHVYG